MSFFGIMEGIFQGFHVTLMVTLLGIAYAVPFALLAGTLQYFSTGWARWTVTIVIEFWRSSSVIVLLYAFYYSLPSFGINLSGLTVGSMVLGLNVGGYGSQSVRGALQALDKGQTEAGLALGLNRLKVLCLIELPQAVASMIPTFVNQAIQLVKGTALVSLLTLTDMTFRAKQISQLSYDPVRIYSALLLSYFIICYPITILGRRLEQRMGKGRRRLNEV